MRSWPECPMTCRKGVADFDGLTVAECSPTLCGRRMQGPLHASRSDRSSDSASISMTTPALIKSTSIRRLSIERFRGIRSLKWLPLPKVNFILGGGDSGKTTLLEAIALLFSPASNLTVIDTDYWERDVDSGFLIEAVVGLADGVAVSTQGKMNWPWHWDGANLLPAKEDGSGDGESVYVFRVRGTPDLELVYEVVQPGDAIDTFPAALRRSIGLVRLSGDERNDRDLRLVQGSALERLLDDKGFRARAASDLADEPVGELLRKEAKESLAKLGTTFAGKALPNPVQIGITGGAGLSLNALVGLTAPKGKTSLPFLSWGAGTRRLGALAIAAQLHEKSPITLVDEIERGLECYRQRLLVRELCGGNSQVFATTHSAAALKAAAHCAIWYLDSQGEIGPLAGKAVTRQLTIDPEAFLAKFTVVAEGATEVGFVTALLERTTEQPLLDYGIHITDAGSNEGALDVLQALYKGGLAFGGIADNEGRNEGRWQNAKKALGERLCRWEKGCLEEEIIGCLREEQFEELIRHDDEHVTGRRLRSLADRLEIEPKDYASIQSRAGTGLRDLIVSACCGAVPFAKKNADRGVRRAFEAHARDWFKSVEGGRELLAKVFSLGIWPKLETRLLPFVNEIRVGVALAKVENVQ
jgi:putative ATP-dependent endonuclease of the OLD family